jgi:dsDNA-specific endonuclease/ATPase MutS2
MTLNEIIFTDNLEKIDLHGYDRDSARVATNDFVNDLLKQKISVGIIIHGIGDDIVRKSVHDTLSKNKVVKEFKIDPFNRGCTLIEIKI